MVNVEEIDEEAGYEVNCSMGQMVVVRGIVVVIVLVAMGST